MKLANTVICPPTECESDVVANATRPLSEGSYTFIRAVSHFARIVVKLNVQIQKKNGLDGGSSGSNEFTDKIFVRAVWLEIGVDDRKSVTTHDQRPK